MELCRINLPVFLIYFNEKRCTNSRFDTIFNKSQFCYDKKIAAKSSGTQKRERAENWWCFCSTSFRTAGVLGNKTSEKKTQVFIFMRRKSGSKHDFKVQLFWEDHKISQLSYNCFDKSANLLSKCQNKWKVTPNFCGFLRKAEL